MYRYEREHVPNPRDEHYYEREEDARRWLQFTLGPMTREKARTLEAQGLAPGPYGGMAFKVRGEIMDAWAPRLADTLTTNHSESMAQLNPMLRWQITNTIRAEVGLPPLPQPM
jgi:hypothetical protein